MNPVPTTFKLDEVGSSGIGAEDVERSEAEPFKRCAALGAIDALNSRFEKRLAARFRVDNSLTRPLVSFQANKARAIYRWFKYKEAFSAGLVEHLLARQKISRGVLLDPFAGSGTSLVSAVHAQMHFAADDLAAANLRVSEERVREAKANVNGNGHLG